MVCRTMRTELDVGPLYLTSYKLTSKSKWDQSSNLQVDESEEHKPKGPVLEIHKIINDCLMYFSITLGGLCQGLGLYSVVVRLGEVSCTFSFSGHNKEKQQLL